MILGGLSIEHDAFVISVNTRMNPYSVAEIEALLVAHESRIEQAQQKLNSKLFQAHVANRDQTQASGDQSNPLAP